MKSVLWVLAVLGAIGIGLFWRIDNWSRDLTSNVASTGDEAGPKPLRLRGTVEQAAERLRKAVIEMPHWKWVDEAVVSDGMSIDLVRRTKLFRFKDDVRVTIQQVEGTDSVVLHVRSQSRLGKADLGQNPRNIKELLSRVENPRS